MQTDNRYIFISYSRENKRIVGKVVSQLRRVGFSVWIDTTGIESGEQFKQKIVEGWQTELPDVWLPGGEVWLTQRSDKIFTVKFDGYIEEKWTEHGMEAIYRDAKEIQAVAYDMMVSGYDSEAISVLRLWKARSIQNFDMKLLI